MGNTEYKRILTVQDISCVGQCSATVALPVLSAAGHETAVLPSAVLSTHTTGFYGFTCRDLTSDMPAIIDHWKHTGITFDAVYTGYLENADQIESVLEIRRSLARDGFVLIADPATADDGELYPAFDMAYVEKMRRLVGAADVVMPNITEACLLTGIDYREEYDEKYIDSILDAMHELGSDTVLLTGVSYDDETTGIAVLEGSSRRYYSHRKSPRSSHGTGDVFASAFVGAYMRGFTAYEAAGIAGDYTLRCIDNTIDDPEHWYGVKFEPELPYYISRLQR